LPEGRVATWFEALGVSYRRRDAPRLWRFARPDQPRGPCETGQPAYGFGLSAGFGDHRMVEIRAFRPADLDDLYRICLATGAGGDEALALYRDPKLVGHVYAAPYAVLSPWTVFVVEDGQ